jgi:glycosyltransferase involved in cell wall biosynthesis
MTGARDPIDIVVPIFGAAAALERCLASVGAHTDLARHRLLLVPDGPQDAAVEAAIAGAERAGATTLRAAERGGFVRAANRGIAAADHDVVLLNSDTQVTAGWLDKLARAAASNPETASVTPFSNSATICSLPRWLVSNALPAGCSLEDFAELVERSALPEYPRLPTGVGFCILLTRTALARVGAFDEGRFGIGYGEEVDWCLRARAAGFVHLLDDATFIYHEGQGSFGPERDVRVRAAHRAIARSHPGYQREIAAFIRADPLRPARQRVLDALASERQKAATTRTTPTARPRVLHVVHGWPPWSNGGTEIYAAGLARRQARWREVTVLARIANRDWSLGDALELDDQGARVQLLVNNFTQRDPRSRNALRETRFEHSFGHLLDESRAELVHVHHLAGLCATLPSIARRRGVPVVYQLQDWWGPCARANLLDASGALCSGPGLGKCSRCLPLTRLPPAPLLNRSLYAWRGRLLRDAIARADLRIAGSQAVVASHRALGWLSKDAAVSVLPYGIEPPTSPLRARPTAGSPLRFGFLGALMPHKGLDIAVDAFAGIDPARGRLLAWGAASGAPDYAASVADRAGPAVELRGPFDAADLDAVYASFDVLLIPSRGLESFGLVAREAMARGVPVLAADRGALPEMFGEGEACGATFDPDQPASLRAWIDRLLDDPRQVDRWRANLPAILSMDEHAERIEDLYTELLAGRARAGRR